MLNLVQLQERLKDVPMQALMQYANGGNPQVPPFLALGELNRRKKMQDSAAAEQAQAMEGAPTVKQQIEQAAGLMALQGNRQKQAAQQQAGIQAALPMAAPNTTTSEPAQLAGGGAIDDIVVPRDYAPGGMVGGFDPEKLKQEMFKEAMQGDVADIPKELLAAVKKAALRGAPGIPNLPMSRDMFKRSDYAGGGIVAFAAGSKDPIGKAPYEEDEEQKKEDAEAMLNTLKKLKAAGMDIAALPGRGIAGAAESVITRPLRAMGVPVPYLPKEFYGGDASSMTPYFDALMRGGQKTAAKTTDLPQADYSNEGRAYERGRPGALNPATEGPMAPRKPTTGIETLLAPPSDGAARPVATPKTTPEIDFLRKLYNQQAPDYEEELRKRGLDVRPRADKTIEELKRQREEVKGEDTFANRLLSLTPGRRFGSGETGRGLMAFEKEQSGKLRQLGLEISKAEDLEAKADYEFKRGNFDKAQTLKTEADKAKADAAKSAGTMGVDLEKVAATRESTAAQREGTAEYRRATNLTQLENARRNQLVEATRSLDKQIETLQGFAALGQPLNPQQKAQLDALQKEREKIRDVVNQKFDQLIAQQGGGGAGGFRVVGVKPNQ